VGFKEKQLTWVQSIDKTFSSEKFIHQSKSELLPLSINYVTDVLDLHGYL